MAIRGRVCSDTMNDFKSKCLCQIPNRTEQLNDSKFQLGGLLRRYLSLGNPRADYSVSRFFIITHYLCAIRLSTQQRINFLTVLGIMSEPSRLIVFYPTTTITTDLIIMHSIYIHFALKLIKIIVEIRAIIYTIQNSDSIKKRPNISYASHQP